MKQKTIESDAEIAIAHAKKLGADQASVKVY